MSHPVTVKGLFRGPGRVLTVARSPIAARSVTVSAPVTVQR